MLATRRGLWRRSPGRLVASGLLLATLVGAGRLSLLPGPAPTHAASVCRLQSPGNAIQHVISLQFDNFHFTRDNPNVPSDLEQVPSLLNFIKSNGILLTNEHTPLISHTGNDILTTQTGVYGDRHGQPVANSYRYYNPDGSTSSANTFTYWTDPVSGATASTTDKDFNMINEAGVNAPATWVPFTRAGCNVGGAGAANIVLENTGQDIANVFGATSPQAIEARQSPDQATADFVGIGIHCAQGDALCSAANGGKPDLLPSEPGGYQGYWALFGHKYVAPQISPQSTMTDLFGKVIKSPKGNIGFPGFDQMTPAVTLSYVAAMQEHNIPITYTYLTNAHNALDGSRAYGPGEAGYEANLKAFDAAFAAFFARLAGDRITAANTLFVISSDEGDHFVGGPASPAGCDGVTTPCSYSTVGEINTNLQGLLATQAGNTTAFTLHADSAPTVYITGHQAPDATARAFEQAVANLTVANPITGATDSLTKYLAGPAQMKILHMVTSDPARTPTFTLFADPNYFLFAGGNDCSIPCITVNPAFAWNHGDVQQEIVSTWVGFVGPGVKAGGVDPTTWADETDIRPTIMYLTGLRDDYVQDGRVLFEDLVNPDSSAPYQARAGSAFLQLAQAYKQLNAPVGDFGLTTLQASTMGMRVGDPQVESRLSALGASRDALTSTMRAALAADEFGALPVQQADATALIKQAHDISAQAHALVGQITTLVAGD